MMRPLLVPGEHPWRLKAIIAALAVFYLWVRFFMPVEPIVLETLSMQAEVVSDASSLEALKQSSSFRMVKLRLSDGTHAFVSWQAEQPIQGDTVGVLVKVLDDGSRRVSLPAF